MDMSSGGEFFCGMALTGPPTRVSWNLIRHQPPTAPDSDPIRPCRPHPRRSARRRSAWARLRLADRAEEGRAVHEADPPDRRPAPGAGLALAPVHLQGPVEVPALAVDVDIEGVER